MLWTLHTCVCNNNDNMSKRGWNWCSVWSLVPLKRLHSERTGHQQIKLKTTNIHKKSWTMMHLKQNNIRDLSYWFAFRSSYLQCFCDSLMAVGPVEMADAGSPQGLSWWMCSSQSAAIHSSSRLSPSVVLDLARYDKTHLMKIPPQLSCLQTQSDRQKLLKGLGLCATVLYWSVGILDADTFERQSLEKGQVLDSWNILKNEILQNC